MSDEVFDLDVLKQLAKYHSATFRDLSFVEEALKARFADMDKAIRALVLAAASGEALLFIGPPGTAKGRLIRVFCDFLGFPASKPSEPRPEGYFEYLLTSFTEPGELFGYYDIPTAVKDKVLIRKDTGMLQKAAVIYLDEVFNASSPILNALLAVMQEKRFHDAGDWIKTPWKCFFGATNRVPERDVLQAFYDRFLLRCEVHNMDTAQGPEPLKGLLSKGWTETYGPRAASPKPGLLTGLEGFHNDVEKYVRGDQLRIRKDSSFLQDLNCVVSTIRKAGLSQMSNRRLVKMLYLMMVDAVYNAVKNGSYGSEVRIDRSQLWLLRDYGLDRRDPHSEGELEEALRHLVKGK